MQTEQHISTSVPFERRTRLWSSGDLWAGLSAGLIGGLAMGAFAFLIAGFYATDIDVWSPVKHIAGIVYPAEVVDRPGFEWGPVVVGTLIQFGTAGVLGALFAVIYRRLLQLPFAMGLPFLMGGVYGLGLWALTFIFLPRLNPVMAAADKPAFLLAHALYGIVLGVAYAALHPKLPRRNPPAAEPAA